MKYYFFWGGPFSNFSEHPIEYRGMTFKTAEHFLHWRKAMYFGDITMADKILNAQLPKNAKYLGRKVSGFRSIDWDAIKEDVMLEILRKKVEQNPEVKELLQKIGKDHYFVEASPFDRIWGIGYSKDEALANKDNWGENLLGQCWNEIYKQFFKEPTKIKRVDVMKGRQIELDL